MNHVQSLQSYYMVLLFASSCPLHWDERASFLVFHLLSSFLSLCTHEESWMDSKMIPPIIFDVPPVIYTADFNI